MERGLGTEHLCLAPARRSRQLLALVALLTGLVYLVWRCGFTVVGGTLWLGIPLLAAEAWALTAVSLFVFSTWRLTVRTAPPPRPGRSVAILVPTYNEAPDVLRATVLGALAVRYEPRPEVWLLDDGDRGWVRDLAAELGTRYLVRPAPRRHAKAGNLNHALEHVEAELLLVLDADHVPFPHFLERTVGYFDDPGVAFVQSPQAFFNRSFQHPRDADDPLLNEQSLFYDVICRGKDRDNAVFWCGSSAVLRRDALRSVGGVATETVVEDTHTAMRLHQAGWRSVYHHEVLAVGLAPEEVTAFLVQRGRWAKGCFQMLRRAFPLTAHGLSWRQRLHYLSSVSHYVEGPQRLIALVVPPAILVSGRVPLDSDTVTYLALFLPQLVLVPLATWAMSEGRYRFLDGERFALVRAFAYTRAVAALWRRDLTFAVTPKGAAARASSPYGAVRPQLAVAALAVAATVYQSLAQALALPGRLTPFAFGATAFWALLSAGLLGAVARWVGAVRHRRRAHRFPITVPITWSVGQGASVPGTARDLNPFGMAVEADEEPPAGAAVHVRIRLGRTTVAATGTVASVRPLADGGWRVGVAFDALSGATQDAILRWCFTHPFGDPLAGGAAVVALPEATPRRDLDRVA